MSTCFVESYVLYIFLMKCMFSIILGLRSFNIIYKKALESLRIINSQHLHWLCWKFLPWYPLFKQVEWELIASRHKWWRCLRLNTFNHSFLLFDFFSNRYKKKMLDIYYIIKIMNIILWITVSTQHNEFGVRTDHTFVIL